MGVTLWRMSRRRAAAWGAAVCLVLGLSAVLDACGFLESRLAYFPSREPFDTPRGVEDVTFRSKDGLTLHGWFMPAPGVGPGAPGAAVLHVHGNAGNIESHADFS